MKVNRKTLPLKLKHGEVQQSSIDNTINNRNIFHHNINSRNLEFPLISENLTNTKNSNHHNNKKQNLIRFNSITSLSNVMKIKRKSTYNPVHTNSSNYFKTSNVNRNIDKANNYLDEKPPNIRIRKESNFDILLNPNNINSYNSREDHFNKNSIIKKENLKALLIKNKLNKHRSSGNLINIKNDYNIINDRVSIFKAKRNTDNSNIINNKIRDSKSKSNPFLICLENINNYKEIKYKFYNDMLDKYKKENDKYVRNNKVSFKNSINNDDDDYMDMKLNRDRFNSTNEFTKIDDNLIIEDFVIDKNTNIKYKYNLNNKLKLKQYSKDHIESHKIKKDKVENSKNNQKSSLKVNLKKKKYVLAVNSSKNNFVNSNNNNDDVIYTHSRKSYPLIIHNKHSITSNLNHLNLNTEFYSCGLSSNNKDSLKLSKFKSEKQLLNYACNNHHKNNKNNVNNDNGNFKYKLIKKDNKKALLNSNVEKNDNNMSSIINSYNVSRFSIKDINNNQNNNNFISISPEYDDNKEDKDNVNYNAENSDEDCIIKNNSKVELHRSQRITKTHNNKENNSNIDKSKNINDESHLNTNKNKEHLILINTNNNSNIIDKKNKKKKRVNFLCCFGK